MRETASDGGRKPRATDKDILGVFRSTSDPVLSTSEVADELPIKRRGTLDRLRSLKDDGDLDSKQIGGRNTVWWLRDDAVDADPNAADRDTSETGEDRREIDPSPDETQRSEDTDNDDESTTTLDAGDLEGNPESTIDDAQAGDELGTDDEPDTFAGVIDAVAADEWEDTDARLADRKAAARAVLEYARDNGSVSKQEAKEDIYPDHGVEGQNARTWYRKNIRPVLNEAAEYDQSARGYKLVVDDAQGDGGLDTDNDEDDAEFSF